MSTVIDSAGNTVAYNATLQSLVDAQVDLVAQLQATASKHTEHPGQIRETVNALSVAIDKLATLENRRDHYAKEAA